MGKATDVDAVIVGAGFAGLYMLHLLRDKYGLRATVIEAGDGVGGTWYWNRYPGARCDIPSLHYSYSFSDEVQQEWSWSEKYAAQPEILAYLEFVAKKFDLNKDIRFSTRVVGAEWDAAAAFWRVSLSGGAILTARFFISGVGVLSTANTPYFEGAERFTGAVYHTSQWPKGGVDFTGKRVGVIGTGATALQMIPIVAEEAGHLTVFQRSPTYSAPLMNVPMDPEEQQRVKADYAAVRRAAWNSFSGVPLERHRPSAMADTAEEREQHYWNCWNDGGFALWLGSYDDLLMNPESNETAAEFVRARIRERVKDPVVAARLTPKKGVAYGTKRQPCETGYYETFNRENVTLVDIKETPIEEITPTGIRTADGFHALDCLVYATGFDAFTGSLFKMNIRGRNGERLQDHWVAGPRTYLGLTTHGFPNLFTITGPQSPSVVFNMPLGIEQHCEWIAGCIDYLGRHGLASIEPTRAAEDGWIAHVKELADSTLLPAAESWYMGANIPGKPRVFMVYLGGAQRYKKTCDEVAANGYEGFVLETMQENEAAVA
jgi:cyclohexanone monooxygenase